MKQINSRDNPNFKALLRLAGNPRERARSGLTVIDGMHLLEAWQQIHGAPEALFVSPAGLARPEIASWLQRHPRPAATLLPDALLREVSPVETPTGIVAVVGIPAPPDPPDPVADSILLDGVQDPGNLGAILRSAAAFGFRQILLSADCAHPWAPKTLRAGMGAQFGLDLHLAADLPGFLAEFRGTSLTTRVTGAADLAACDPLGGALAWVIGGEGAGVRDAVAARATRAVSIAMTATTESLNVVAAASICLYQTQVWRRQKGVGD